MSKLNSRFSHLRINIGNEELRNGDNKIKKIPSRDSNTFRIQSPKNLNTFTNRQIQVVYTSPPTAKKDNNNLAEINQQYIKLISGYHNFGYQFFYVTKSGPKY